MDSRIKVLVIVNAVFGYDGISNVASNYYRYQDKQQVKMDLLTINPINSDLASVIEADGNQHYVLSGRNKNPLQYVLQLRKIVADNHYDIVYVHGNSATMAVELLGAWLGGCKLRIAHSHNTRCDHQTINKLLKPLFSRLYTHCCACSVEAGQFLFGDRDCKVVNNGLYLPKYAFDSDKRSEIRKKIGAEDKFVIGHIGRFAYQKNHGFLLKILRAVVDRGEDAVLLLVGEGELVQQIKEEAAASRLEDRVIFYGTTDYVNEVVQAMDCFAFPSRFEGLGIVALEAQASGLSCVASDQVPEKMKVNQETVFLSLDADISLWADAVIARKALPEVRKQNIPETKKLLEKAGYDIEANCVDMLDYFKQMLARGRK